VRARARARVRITGAIGTGRQGRCVFSATLVTKPRCPRAGQRVGSALVGRASINPASPGGRTLANNKASGVIFQDGELRCSVDGTARYYLASWGRTHLTPSRGRASAQKGRPQRQRISYLSPRERTRHTAFPAACARRKAQRAQPWGP